MILEQIQNDLKEAMKSGEAQKVSTLRFLLAQIQNRQIALGPEAVLTDEEIVGVIQKQAKERRESIEAFKSAGRDDLQSKEEGELAILGKYLPQQLTEEQLEKIVAEIIVETGSTTSADFGKVMGVVMEKVKGQAEGTKVKEMVESCLTK